MSLEAVREGFRIAATLTPRARVIYNVLADEVRTPSKCPRWVPEDFRGRVCWPGEKLLAEKSGYSRRTVRRALGDLREAKVIRSQPRASRNGRGSSSDIHELFGPAFLPDDQWDNLGRLVRPNHPDNPVHDHPDNPVQESGDHPDNVAPEPSIEEPTTYEPPNARTRERNGRGQVGGLKRSRFADAFAADPDPYPDDKLAVKGASDGT